MEQREMMERTFVALIGLFIVIFVLYNIFTYKVGWIHFGLFAIGYVVVLFAIER